MFKLDSFGLTVELEVVGYKPNSTGWCGLDFHVYGEGIDLHIDGKSESLLTLELEDVTRYLGSMLKGKLKKTESIYCSEADFQFFVLPNTKRLVIKANILKDRRNTPNYLELNFYEEECMALYEYLTQKVGVLKGYAANVDIGDNSDLCNDSEGSAASNVGGENNKTYRYIKVVYDPESSMEYSYLDENRIADYDDYVWVPVGKFNEQKIAFVVELNDFTIDKVPFPLDKVKKVLRLASEEEVAKIEESW